MEFQSIYSMLIWWCTLFIIGVISIPTCMILFPKHIDAGYAFTKAASLALVSYCVFVFSVFHIAAFSKVLIVIVLCLWAFINFIIGYKNLSTFRDLLKNVWPGIIISELLFTIGFISWTIVRSYQPDIEGLEKFMDFGFVNSILRTELFPPIDMWFSGNAINYYWFGHYITAFIIKLSGVHSGIGYNMMIATIFGLVVSQVFSLASFIIRKCSSKIAYNKIILGSLISAFAVVLAGNFHTPYILFQNSFEKYWYPDATRFIGYNPDTQDKTIHEFPLYSFVVSDLHAHLINLPFVILYLALLSRVVIHKNVNFLTHYAPLGFLLGLMFTTNSWDLGNYGIVSACTIGISLLATQRLNLKRILQYVFYAIGVLGIAFVTAYPFLSHFKSIAEGVEFVHAQSPLWQLAILWGFPFVLTVYFGLVLLLKTKEIKRADIFIIGIMTAGWVLIALPEIIYIKDIYGASHHRANTMFKLTYQAFVLFYLSSGYIIIRSLTLFKNFYQRIIVALFSMGVLSLVFIYPYYAITTFYGDFYSQKSLNGTTWLTSESPDLLRVIEWFNNNVTGQPVILEAAGDSYTKFNVVSAYTGLPTPVGWFVHEWLWRGAPGIPQSRSDDVQLIYTLDNSAQVSELITKYDISYVIISQKEYERYPLLTTSVIASIGTIVFSTETATVYKVK
jgi:uncharacterized membrane protein